MRIASAFVPVFLIALNPGAAGSHPSSNPFALLRPVAEISDEERRRIDQRGVIVRILPASGHELATVVAGSLNVGPDALLASARNIVELKKSKWVPQIGRFSDAPRIEDLRDLTLDDIDVNEIRRCRPDRCGLKLTPDEIARLHETIAARPDSRADLDMEFRRVVLSRAREYLRQGARYNREEFSALLAHSPYVRMWVPALPQHLERYPAAPLGGAESFLYWTKETNAWKPMISVTHVTMLRDQGEGAPEVVIVSRDVFATRYTSASLVLTLLFADDASPSRWYLVYLNRTWVDGLRGLWRPFVEYRIKSQAKGVFADARNRIERTRALDTSKARTVSSPAMRGPAG